jgi:hypothetical protein
VGEKRDLCIGFLDEDDTQIIFSQGNISLGIISFSLEFILDWMIGVLQYCLEISKYCLGYQNRSPKGK